MDSNLYDILQVAPHAEPEVIESAYKRLALKYHPDVNRAADAHERMRALNHAYTILSDPAERARYDSRHEINSFVRRRPMRRAASKPKKRATTKTKSRRKAQWTPPAREKRETVKEAVSVSDALIADAAKLSKKYRTVSSDLLQTQLKLKYPRALNLFATLMERGMIDEQGNWI